ncbi:hypothetical protein MRB53_026915 [Persea americana]|uniref:Uncharacterized protein n=1 Tax=Persea americana TaxID=3435 RepID=A0ACC2LJJ4_PERAE|nr:hypothetical protein MRB53_026915 [Persea americana]
MLNVFILSLEVNVESSILHVKSHLQSGLRPEGGRRERGSSLAGAQFKILSHRDGNMLGWDGLGLACISSPEP